MNTDSKIALTKEESYFIEKLIKDNQKHIKNVIINTLGPENRYLAEDTINELYLLMCKKTDILKTHPCPKAWILVASKHTAQGMISKHKKDLFIVPIERLSHERGMDDVFEDAVYEIWLENKVPEKLIAHLTKREREVYLKIYIENKRPKEVAEELDISVNCVNNIHKNLRDKIKDDIKRKNF